METETKETKEIIIIYMISVFVNLLALPISPYLHIYLYTHESCIAICTHMNHPTGDTS